MDDTCSSPNSNPDVCPNAICLSSNSSQKRTCMQWNIEKDIMMMREVAALGVLIQKPGKITEYDILVEELIEVSDDTDAQKDEKSQEKKNAVDEDRVKAIDIRNTAMERYGETRKRKALNNEDKSPKTSRRSSNDTLIFLREKWKQIKKIDALSEKKELKQELLLSNNKIIFKICLIIC
nr:uncharacterized protein LOC124818690 [Hydra vulgaris]